MLPIDDNPNIDAGVMSVAISPDARFVTAGSLNTVVRICDVATCMLLDHLRRHSDSIYSVAFTPDGPGVRLARQDTQELGAQHGAAVHNVRKAGERLGKSVLDFTGHKDSVLSVAILHAGQ